jgi:hypothetical protein
LFSPRGLFQDETVNDLFNGNCRQTDVVFTKFNPLTIYGPKNLFTRFFDLSPSLLPRKRASMLYDSRCRSINFPFSQSFFWWEFIQMHKQIFIVCTSLRDVSEESWQKQLG